MQSSLPQQVTPLLLLLLGGLSCSASPVPAEDSSVRANLTVPGRALPAATYQWMRVQDSYTRYPDSLYQDTYYDRISSYLRGRSYYLYDSRPSRFERRLFYYLGGGVARPRLNSVLYFVNGTAVSLPPGYVLVNVTSSSSSSTSSTSSTTSTTPAPQLVYAVLKAVPVDYPSY